VTGDALPRTVAVLGLGLIGGSLARDLAALGVRVIGCDRDAGSTAAALREGVVQHATHDVAAAQLDDAEVIILALPVTATLEALETLAGRGTRAALITDVASTKVSVTAAATRLGLGSRFVGGHPLAGHHTSGWAASRTGLFAAARVYLCSAPGVDAGALALAHGVWRAVGGAPELIDAAEHDGRLAWISHLPQVTASLLAAAISEAGFSAGDLGPGGRDTTRLAGSAAEMWTDIAVDNAAELGCALGAVEARIAAFRAALSRGDRAAVRTAFERARAWSD
jgi:prephenate dehydrogenase